MPLIAMHAGASVNEEGMIMVLAISYNYNKIPLKTKRALIEANR